MTEEDRSGTRRRGEHAPTDLAESPLSATWRPAVLERAVLVGIDKHGEESSLDELAALAETAGAEAVARLVQARTAPDPATFIGKGKLKELHDLVHATGAPLVVIDQELSPGQLRTLEERLGVKVVDRTALILDIFALHARSREGKAQVELAQLNYLLPRLRGWGEAMSRLGGGIGTRGPGETKLEVDRQHIRRRISRLRDTIKDLARTRAVKRSGRERSGIPQVAIAGYTNAGKSTLVNALAGSDVLVANQLFATLDPTVRRLRLPGGRDVTISDTVGFVRKLPHDLVEAFRSTLEEVARASLVLHLADGSSSELDQQVAAVREVLAEIGAGDLPEVLALNKVDRVAPEERDRLAERYPDGVMVSALRGEGLSALLEAVELALPAPPIEVEVLVPYDRQDLVARLHREAEVISAKETDEGTALRARIGEALLGPLESFLTRSVTRWS